MYIEESIWGYVIMMVMLLGVVYIGNKVENN